MPNWMKHNCRSCSYAAFDVNSTMSPQRNHVTPAQPARDLSRSPGTRCSIPALGIPVSVITADVFANKMPPRKLRARTGCRW